MENSAPYRADWKGIVERRFGLLHAAFGPYTPGFIEPDFRERGARDYRLDGLCCTNPVRDSSRESSVIAGTHEQTDTHDLQDQELAGLQ